ncbi:MAG: hypothetical protein K1X89_12195 [Myxococcaceae bacterium]|nr:hypothetical protein [Myxococcaceae bacterium]
MPSVEDYAQALQRVHPRSAQVLIAATLEGRSEAETAALYGLAAEPFATLLGRATDELAHTLEQPTAGLLEALRAEATALRTRLEALERAELASPAHRRELWLRRLAILAILALTGYYWWRDGTPPLPGPTPPSRVRTAP